MRLCGRRASSCAISHSLDAGHARLEPGVDQQIADIEIDRVVGVLHALFIDRGVYPRARDEPRYPPACAATLCQDSRFAIATVERRDSRLRFCRNSKTSIVLASTAHCWKCDSRP